MLLSWQTPEEALFVSATVFGANQEYGPIALDESPQNLSLNLAGGRNYVLCIEAQNWLNDAVLDFVGLPMVSRSCVNFTMQGSANESSSGGSNSSEPTPQPTIDPIPEPP